MGEQVTAAVSLLVSTPGRADRTLLGVRTATATSARHPEVLSTPTMRIPPGVLDAVLAEELGETIPSPEVGEIRILSGCPEREFGGAQASASGVSHLVETTMARKLGCADALLRGDLHGHARAVALAYDRVPDAATEADEMTLMLTVAVHLGAGVEHLPASTPSYSRFTWAANRKLGRAIADNDPLLLDPDLDLMVCIHGLCVRSAAALPDFSQIDQ
jgi:hypothetical protein